MRPPAAARSRIEVPTNIAELVGNTPLVRFKRLEGELDVELIGKLEGYNPAGSVKDRADVRQHWDRARVRVRGEGLPADHHASTGHEPRARGLDAPVRRRGDRD